LDESEEEVVSTINISVKGCELSNIIMVVLCKLFMTICAISLPSFYPQLMKFGGGYWCQQTVEWLVCWWNVMSQTPPTVFN